MERMRCAMCVVVWCVMWALVWCGVDGTYALCDVRCGLVCDVGLGLVWCGWNVCLVRYGLVLCGTVRCIGVWMSHACVCSCAWECDGCAMMFVSALLRISLTYWHTPPHTDAHPYTPRIQTIDCQPQPPHPPRGMEHRRPWRRRSPKIRRRSIWCCT